MTDSWKVEARFAVVIMVVCLVGRTKLVAKRPATMKTIGLDLHKRESRPRIESDADVYSED